jgi:hypothetical protein
MPVEKFKYDNSNWPAPDCLDKHNFDFCLISHSPYVCPYVFINFLYQMLFIELSNLSTMSIYIQIKYIFDYQYLYKEISGLTSKKWSTQKTKLITTL